jgi:hypothetical protein
MPPATRELDTYRRDAKANHKLLTPAEREKLITVNRRNNSLQPRTNKIAAIPPNAAHIKTLQRRKHPFGGTQLTFAIGTPEVPSNPTTRSYLRCGPHDFLRIYTAPASISCGEGSDSSHSILPPSNTRAHSKRCQRTVAVAAAFKCYSEA